jgi:hypothetical protein
MCVVILIRLVEILLDATNVRQTSFLSEGSKVF